MSDTVPDLLAALIRSVDAARAERKRENDAWGERPEDVLLCTHREESGHCSLPYGHDGEHALPPATTKDAD